MSSIIIKGNTSGQIELAAPDVAGSTTLTLPTGTGTVLLSDGDGSNLTNLPQPAALTTASGSAPSYSARAWVNFNGTGTVAIRASGNVSYITDHTTGAYSLNFSTAMPDTNYSVTGSVIGSDNRGSGGWGTNPPSNGATGANNYSTSSFRFTVLNNSDTAYVDCDHISIQVFR